MTHDPGLHSLFETDSPSRKLRFMYMAGLQIEEEMDKTWQPFSVLNLGDKIKCPYLTVVGEDDQLSRIEYTYQMLDAISAPKLGQLSKLFVNVIFRSAVRSPRRQIVVGL